MKRLGWSWVLLMLLLVTLASCSERDNAQVFVIDDHRFVVPESVVLPGHVAWFAWSNKTESLHFIIDPKKPVGQRASALVESRKITCRPDKVGTSPMLSSACGASHEPVFPTAKLHKQHQFPGNDTFWEYTAEDDAGRRHIVASCFALTSKIDRGTCSAFGRYSSLVYSFSFDDSEIGRLNEVRSQIESLLGAWEEH